MKIQEKPPLHLTYCLSVHPGESWAENFAAIRNHALRVRDMVSNSSEPFALGMRLSRRAAEELTQPQALAEFKKFLEANNLYVFTINGFPYGKFHQAAIKENVYRPDWRTAERRDYTILLADILAELLSGGMTGSISTVPCSYKAWIGGVDDVKAMVEMICDVAWRLAEIHQATGKDISLAIEPEPDCFVENIDEIRDFFAGPLLKTGSRFLMRKYSPSRDEADGILRRHIGICLDTSHLAVEFEDPVESIHKLIAAGIRISKVQLSSALRLSPTPEALKQLADFRDDVYLHQTKVKTLNGTITSFRDLPEAMQAAISNSEWRVHFHLPLFFEELGDLKSTASQLKGEFAELLKSGITEHLEIETYTYDVLPKNLRPPDIATAIANEYKWTLTTVGRRA